MRILGVDSGINGACALYVPGSEPQAEHFFDIPTVGEGNRREINYPAFRDLIFYLQPTHAVIELVNAFVPTTRDEVTGEEKQGKWGGTSLFRFGGAYYAIRAVIGCLEIPLYSITAAQWTGEFKLGPKKKGGGTDDRARQCVLQQHPGAARILTHKKHQHQAEAFLIGKFGRRKIAQQEEDLAIPE